MTSSHHEEPTLVEQRRDGFTHDWFPAADDGCKFVLVSPDGAIVNRSTIYQGDAPR